MYVCKTGSSKCMSCFERVTYFFPRICDGDAEVNHTDLSSEERVGSLSFTLHHNVMLYVILHFNITLHGNWTVYASEYSMDFLGNDKHCLSVVDYPDGVRWKSLVEQVAL